MAGHLSHSRATSVATMILCMWNCAAFGGCDRAPQEPGPTPDGESAQAGGSSSTGGGSPESSDGDGGGEPQAAACVVPLADPPPPEVPSLANCPEDPDGRPEMPTATVRFPDATEAPTLEVEWAMTDPHRSHGLMYRPTLEDDEGMLFSWTDERQRTFWMKNTCLALDMLFIAQDGTIAGILENVPPWNETPTRTVPCPAAHVLEVRAGWTRAHGVKPGQSMIVVSGAP